jgi:p24 family protein delta-1
MALSFVRCAAFAALILTFLGAANGLKFDIAAHTGHSSKYERCIRNFVASETLVVVTAIVDGHEGDGQSISMRVSSAPWRALPPGH